MVVEHTLLSLGILKIGPFPIQYLGIMGVMVFFVLTTLVLMWSLERKPHTLDFYIRRVFRIYPLALAAIAMVVHVSCAGIRLSARVLPLQPSFANGYPGAIDADAEHDLWHL